VLFGVMNAGRTVNADGTRIVYREESRRELTLLEVGE